MATYTTTEVRNRIAAEVRFLRDGLRACELVRDRNTQKARIWALRSFAMAHFPKERSTRELINLLRSRSRTEVA